MSEHCIVIVSKTDVLTEDYSGIFDLINSFIVDSERLVAARNTWDLFFEGYDDDPREIPDIPEIVNWIDKSISAGIPWFYFMRTGGDSAGLLSFMVCCGTERDPDIPEQYYFDQGKLMRFVDKGLDNLSVFVEDNNIPEDVGRAAANSVLEFIQNSLQCSATKEQQNQMADDKKKKEALKRLDSLEKLYHLNPNVRRYFKEERLYYSYITGGGYIGSIDTINYDERYAAAVKRFEETNSCLAYHVIECGDTISILFVGDDYKLWLDERPTIAGVIAYNINIKTNESRLGYIKLDCLHGALYQVDTKVYSSLPKLRGNISELSAVDAEVVERLEILKRSGLMTDLDIVAEYIKKEDVFCSMPCVILGTLVGVIDRISKKPAYEKLVRLIAKQTQKKIYFLIGSLGGKIAFLYVSDDPSDWSMEKLDLENGNPHAIVVDTKELEVTIQPVEFSMENGGPVLVLD